MTKILVAGITELDENKFQPVISFEEDLDLIGFYQINKPDGCLWGSTLTTDELYLSDWLCFSITGFEPEVAMKYNEGIVFNLKDNARILTLQSIEDYISLPDKYFIDGVWGAQYEILKKKVLNWESISEDYDAFHLTKSAICSMRMPLNQLEKNGERLSDFYSWDVESWVMFNLDCIDRDSIQKLDNLYLTRNVV